MSAFDWPGVPGAPEGTSSVLQNRKSVVPKYGSAQQNHASYSLKGLGIRLRFPGQPSSPFRVKNVLADNGLRPNYRSRIGNCFGVFNADRRLSLSRIWKIPRA